MIPCTLLWFGFYFYVGLVNFLISAPFYFLSLSLAWKLLKGKEGSFRTGVGLAPCLLAAYFSHIVTFGFAVMMIFLHWLLFFRNRKIWVLFLAVLPSAMAFFLYMKFRPDHEPALTLAWEPFRVRLETLLMPFNLFRDGRIWIFDHSLVLVWICALILVCLGFLLNRSPITPNPGVRILAISTLILVGSALLLPSYVAANLGIALRAPYFAAFSLVGALPSEWYLRRATRWAMILVCALLPVLLFTRLNTFQAEMSDLERVLDKIPPRKVIQPIITEAQSAAFHTYPFLHAAEWYSYYKGGYSPYLFPSESTYFPVRPRREFLPDVPGEWQMDKFVYDRHHSETDYFLVRTRRKDILDDLTRNVPMAARAGDWVVFGPDANRHLF